MAQALREMQVKTTGDYLALAQQPQHKLGKNAKLGECGAFPGMPGDWLCPSLRPQQRPFKLGTCTLRRKCARVENRFLRGFCDSGTPWMLSKAVEQYGSCVASPPGGSAHTPYVFIKLQTNDKAVSVYLQVVVESLQFSLLSMFLFCNTILSWQTWVKSRV